MKNRIRGLRIGASMLCAVLLGAMPAQSQIKSSVPLFGEPLPLLSDEHLTDFYSGLEEFEKVFTPEAGLGPIFNGDSCAACHSEGAIGGGSAVTVTRFGRMINGQFDPLTELGGSLLQRNAIDPALQEVVPAEANVVAHRRSQALFGLGLIEAIPDATIVSNSLVRKAMGVKGRLSIVVDAATGESRIGRFGWKAQHATLLAFAGDASVNELGISNRVFAHENVPNGKTLAADSAIEDVADETTGKAGVDRLTDFMRFLAQPPTLPVTVTVDNGERWFNQVGCHQCHTKVMFTGPSSIPALDRKPVLLWSDLLLHDMGSLGDGIAQGSAGPRELRTSPLWGLRMQSTFLHDGRASSVEAAILMHDGEAAPSREFYIRSLPRDQQLELLEFLLAI